jgi:acyl-CoA dehydrogenase
LSELQLLEDTVAELFAAELASERDGSALWATLEESGLTLAGIPEELAGSGGGIPEAAAIVRLAGYFAAPVPLAETALIGGWALAEANLRLPAGPVTAAADSSFSLERAGADWILSGTATQVPWARGSAAIAVLVDGRVARVPTELAVLEPGENLAAEPRDTITFDRVHVPAEAVAPAVIDAEDLQARGALARALGIAGALERILELSIQYALEREQFGRPIGRFQAVQQELALLAAEVAGARAAVDLAVESPEPFWIATAKIRTGDAAGRVATIAHQVHGAIGYTQEHDLHLYTRRIWAWRDEYGSEEEWSVRLGELVAASGADDLWPLLTETGLR